MELKPLKEGQRVIYIDSKRQEHNALVTAPWSETCCNLVYVSSDKEKGDSYGRQIERECSCVHISLNDANAQCWKHPEEV